MGREATDSIRGARMAPAEAWTRDGRHAARTAEQRSASGFRSLARRSALTAAVALLISALAACGGANDLVPLLASGVPLTQPTAEPLRVVTRSTAVEDPLRVRGGHVSFADVEAALGHAIASATVPWAESHRRAAAGTEGWELLVEVINDSAQFDGKRLVVTIAVRATLHQRAGNVYLAQAQANCRQADVLPSDGGVDTVVRCMSGIGRDLAGWLDGVNLDANSIAPHHQ